MAGNSESAVRDVPTSVVDEAELQRKVDLAINAAGQRPMLERPLQSLAVFHWGLMPFLCMAIFFLLW